MRTKSHWLEIDQEGNHYFVSLRNDKEILGQHRTPIDKVVLENLVHVLPGVIIKNGPIRFYRTEEDVRVSFTEDETAQGQVNYNYTLQEFPSAEAPGLSVFYKDAAGDVFHTYSTYGRGLEALIGTYQILDLVPKGRDEDKLGFPMEWIRYHDRYGTDTFADANKPYWPETAEPSSTSCGCASAEAHA